MQYNPIIENFYTVFRYNVPILNTKYVFNKIIYLSISEIQFYGKLRNFST